MVSFQRKHLLFTVTVVLLFATVSSAGNNYRRVCFYYDPVHLPVSRLNISLCTHIIYYGVGYINGSLTFGSDQDEQAVAYIKQLQKDKGGFKLMVCHGSSDMNPLIFASPEKMAHYVNATVSFLVGNQLGGIDLDWEFPWVAGRKNFSIIIRMLRQAFDAAQPPLLLSVDVSGVKLVIVESYDMPSMAYSLDFVNIMGYDYRAWGQNYPLTAHHSPLYASKLDYSYLGTLNVNWSVNYFISNGFPRDRVVVGIPVYSHGWSLIFQWDNGVMAPADGTGAGEGLSRSSICEFLKKNGTQYRIDADAHAPYAFNGKDWCSFDDEYSVAKKVQYIKDNGLGGTMVWALFGDADYANRSCGTKDDFPIHAMITRLLI